MYHLKSKTIIITQDMKDYANDHFAILKNHHPDISAIHIELTNQTDHVVAKGKIHMPKLAPITATGQGQSWQETLQALLDAFLACNIYAIIAYPNALLQRKGILVEDFSAIQPTIDRMFRTHYAQENCAALAATQLSIDDAPHITVIDYSQKKDQPLCIINGKIIEQSGQTNTGEGCMSILGFQKAVKRAETITLEYQDRDGQKQMLKANGFLAKCIQHELDHLEGVLYIDRISDRNKQKITSKIIRKAKR